MMIQLLSTLLLFFSFACTLLIGEIPLGELLSTLFSSEEWHPLLDERLPRAIVLATTGASLCISGMIVQAVFQNPLASPSILGITAGGTLSLQLALIFTLHLSYSFILPLAATGGCLTSLFSLYLWRKKNHFYESAHLLLVGIALTTFLGAFQNALLFFFRDDWQLMRLLAELNSASSTGRTWINVHGQLPIAIVAFLITYRNRNELNILSLGEEEALSLGVDVEKVRFHLFFAVSLLIGGALTALGLLPFFAFAMPHLLRGMVGCDHRKLFPLAITLGGSSLQLMDIFLRVFKITMISLSSLSSILGSSFFFYLLYRRTQAEKASRAFNEEATGSC